MSGTLSFTVNMIWSPLRTSLYRSGRQVVICATLALTLTQIGRAQFARKNGSAGPRALGLLELAPNGKAHLVPIAILIDGKFYDASAYKADPVPFALDAGVVYEAVHTGVSQGLFTVNGALQARNNWVGEGTWQAAGSTPPKKIHRDEKPPQLDDDSGPPRLHKAEPVKPAPPPQTSPPPETKASAPPTSSSSAQTATAASAPRPSEEQQNNEDPNRPVLRRGVPQPHSSGPADEASASEAMTAAYSPAAASAPKSKLPTKAEEGIQMFPAISDAHGPDPRPYAFEMKPEEEQGYRKKMLALAVKEIQEKVREMTPEVPGSTPATRTKTRVPLKAPVPTFDNIQFHAFDLWNTNQPVFVMSAWAHLPASRASGSPTRSYFLTLVASADIYLDLHKLWAQVTDEQHLDEFPKLELVDAVDADGDGRGELLFREISDAGTAWAIFRATPDTLFPLYEGTPINRQGIVAP
jgi:hypothetical protein